MWYLRANYGKMVVLVGADTAFDKRMLTSYFASRTCALRILLIATKIAKAVKEVPAVFAQAFQPAVVTA